MRSYIKITVGRDIARLVTFALFAFAAFISPASASEGASEAIAMRGVVEGYYGRPWGTEGRISLLNFMGEMDMNVFIYGPKDDPYHHSKWREPYPESDIADFKKLLACAAKNKVSFYWAIHLGSGFRKGNEEDFAALLKKLGWMHDAGFRSFAVFFDDFGSADAEFHADVCNRVLKEFLDVKKDCSSLILCPNVYWGTGHPYQKTLGDKLDQRIHIMWTGHWICSDIKEADVAKITADFKRPPFIWWNWPVNDYCRSSLLLGRTYGLDPCKFAGVVSNPMENCEANKVALYGFAKWCKDPKGFDSKKVWEESFDKIYRDKNIAKAMRVFAEHNSDQGPNGHGYRREESVSAAPLCAKARAELDSDERLSKETRGKVAALFKEVRQACAVLEKNLPKGRYDLGWEIEGWVRDEGLLMKQGECALELLDAKSFKAAKVRLEELRKLRALAEKSGKKHVEKFKAATFGGDSGHSKPPKASSRELRPLVEKLSTVALTRLCKMKGGAALEPRDTLRAFSTAKSLAGITASRDGKYASISRVMEQREVGPNETFGISVPKLWATDYFHAKLGEEAAKSGIIEVSKDGKEWTKLNTRNNGGEMQTRLNPNDRWLHARYRNTSASPVRVKIDLFKFDVTGNAGIVDELLDRLLSAK